MHILALDTTSRAGSIAIARDGAVLHQASGDPALTHGQRLPGDMMHALTAAGVRVDDLDLLAVAAGPGSFTGLRVGVAAIQGIAVARGLTVVPVPTLEALARAGLDAVASRDLIAAWMDGQRGEVFGAVFAVDLSPDQPSPRLRQVHEPVAGSPSAVLDAWRLSGNVPAVFIGDGAVRYRAILAEKAGPRPQVIEPPALAPVIARIAFEQPHRAVAPDAIVPIYVRRPDAELARERRQGRV